MHSSNKPIKAGPRMGRHTFATTRPSVHLAVLTALAACGAAHAQQAAPAAEPSQPVEEVVVTGSRIAQNLDTTSLPVTILTSVDIAKTGQTSVTDLIQNLPAMQGFVPASSSVNGGGGGVTTAALHSLPSKYTLTLIDGQRVAPFALGSVQGFGYGVNIDSIPLSAIERVEVLTDGASALYGADAVAGVVNFILKKDTTAGEAYYNLSDPSQSGGGGWNAGISKGFGNLTTDGYNVLITYSHDVQYKLQASQRSVSSAGAYFPFSSGGTNYIMFAPTSNTTPANVTIGSLGVVYNPYYQANGNCGNVNAFPLTTSEGTNCRFNYAATVQDIPGSVRDSGMLKATFNIADNQKVWAEVLLSQFDMTSQYAPPAQPLGVSPTNALNSLWTAYVVPYLTATDQVAASATLNYRAVPAGGRTDDYGTNARQIALGWEGNFSGWQLTATALASHGRLIDRAAGGYLDYDQFVAAVASGAYDPVLATGGSAIQSAILHATFSTADSDVKSIQIGATHDIYDFGLGGGTSILSVGAEEDWTKYTDSPSNLLLTQSGYSTQPSDSDFPVGGNYGQVPFEADRTNWGLFGEYFVPILKNLDATASVRYDSYSKAHSTTVFGTVPDESGLIPELAPADEGDTFSDATYKISFRYTPIDMVSFRGSYGTGFRAPALSDIVGPLAFGGSTSGTYACPFPGSVGCLPGSAQYDLLTGANGASGAGALKPEKSKQWTLGTRVEPLQGLSLTLDYWNVTINNQIQSAGIAEQVAFNNPGQYAALFQNPYLDPAGFETIALEQVPFNGGVAHYSGLDWHVNYHINLDWGKLSAAWTGTYMLTQNYTDYAGGPELSDLGQYGPDQQVVFKTISNLQVSLETGKWVNTLTAHYKSGYRDQQYSAGDGVVFLVAPGGGLGDSTDFAGLQVPSFVTWDWQTSYDIATPLNVTFGVKNLGNKSPPLSLQTGGGGNAVGFDGRYYDPTGRTYYLKLTAHF